MAFKQHNRGFSLVEIMVGLVIGMFATLTIFGAYTLSERQKRTTTGAAAANTNGALALHMLERDIKMAGFGLEPSAVETCANLFTYDSNNNGPVKDFFTGVFITDGGDGPDSLTLRYYGDPTEANIDFSRSTLTKNMPDPSAELNVSRAASCAAGNLAFVMQAKNKNCTLVEVTGVERTPDKLQHNSGVRYNPAASYRTTNLWPAYSGCGSGSCDDSASVQCFSKFFKRTYSVDKNLNLILDEEAGDTKTEHKIAQQIIDVQALYGTAPAGSQSVTQWETATGGAWASPLSRASVRSIKAVRLAIVARSPQPEKPRPGEGCKTTETLPTSTLGPFKNVEMAAPTDWQCYRYKVFETVIPLRNVIWGNV